MGYAYVQHVFTVDASKYHPTFVGSLMSSLAVVCYGVFTVPQPLRLRHGVLRATLSLQVLLHATRPQHLPGRLLLPLHECFAFVLRICRSWSSNGRLFVWCRRCIQFVGCTIGTTVKGALGVVSITSSLRSESHDNRRTKTKANHTETRSASPRARSRRAHRRHAAAAQVVH
eukprot:TRINITY_DN65615_c0_g1_i5.p1 TRINITY_DN65615_c0_g1~~TRINITY_DN65615_c0_g1_i5.p1  ORF type:complete len:172 (-),score=9.85 TRINITY_DN65615_c0_g1_i5:353-868(-)